MADLLSMKRIVTDNHKVVKHAQPGQAITGIGWIARQLVTAPPDRFVTAPTRPSSRVGVICSGSATAAVEAWLKTKHPRAYWTKAQILAGTGRTVKSVDWALIFLRTTGRVEIGGDHRNPRYLSYRLTPLSRTE